MNCRARVSSLPRVLRIRAGAGENFGDEPREDVTRSAVARSGRDSNYGDEKCVPMQEGYR